MKVSRVFLSKEAIINLITGNLEKKNHPVGYSYCDEEKGKSCSVFIGTDRDTGELQLTKGGDFVLNIKTHQGKKKGDHVANTSSPEVSAEAEASDEAEEETLNANGLTPSQEAALQAQL
jgi:hypothetical protein